MSPVPKYISSGVWPPKAECMLFRELQLLRELHDQELARRVAPVMLDVVEILRRDGLAVLFADFGCQVFLADAERALRASAMICPNVFTSMISSMSIR